MDLPKNTYVHTSPLLLNPWQPQIIRTVSIVLPFPECLLVWIVQYVEFSQWLLVLSNMHVKLFHVFLWCNSSLLALNCAKHYLNIPQFIHSPREGHLDCFPFLAIIHKAAMNIHVPVLQICFHFLWVNTKESDWQYNSVFRFRLFFFLSAIE
jgi:hypothetical protein